MKIFDKILGKKSEDKKEETEEEQNDEEKSKGSLDQQISSERFLTHLSTDKPIYRAGEKVYIRGVVLHGLTRVPHPDLPNKMRGKYAVLEVISPSGDKVFEVNLENGEESVVSGFWDIPPTQAGGDYKIRLSWKFANFPPAEREFNIRTFRNPRIKSQIKFEKKGYGINDEAVAILNVKRAEGEVPEGALISASARIDGVEVFSKDGFVLDSQGDVIISFKIPLEITEGDGTLSCRIQDGGTVENASQTIPLLLQKMDVRVYPEGGYLISGVSNRFYLEAFTKSGDPADLYAEIVEGDKGKVVGTVSTDHEGRGRGDLVPIDGKEYHLRVLKPSGIINKILFPSPQSKGVSLSTLSDTFSSDSSSIDVELTSNQNFKGIISLFRTKVNLDSQEVKLKAGESKQFSLDCHNLSGVLRVTLFEDEKNPIAERITFKHPKKGLKINFKSAEENYSPGNTVNLNVTTTDGEGNPVKAFVGITVTDDSVLEMVEKRKQVPRLPEIALLESEVDHLHDCQFYFNESEEKANLSIDLLLGTQGWRRFVFQNSKLRNEIPIDKRQRLVITKPLDPMPIPQANNREKGAPMLRLNVQRRVMKKDAEVVDKKKSFAASPQKEGNIELKNALARPASASLIAQPVERDQSLIITPVASIAAPIAPVLQEEKQKIEVRASKLQAPSPSVQPISPSKALGPPPPPQGKIMPFSKLIAPLPRNHQVVVREYAHQNRPGRVIGERSDFTETIFWKACLETNDKGVGKVSFTLNDSISSFKIWGEGFTKKGALASHSFLIESREPFYLEAKLPLEVTSGDLIQLPVSLVNNIKEDAEGEMKIELEGEGLKLMDSSNRIQFKIQAEKRERKLLNLSVNNCRKSSNVKISGSSPHASDSVTRTLQVVPNGFPMQLFASGTIKPHQSLTHSFSVPSELLDGTMETSVKVYCSPAGSLMEAVKSLNRCPSGCFEQTSTTTYPLIMAIKYMKGHQGTNEQTIQDCLKNLKIGYDRLKGYECKNGGFDWFGSDPGHEALSAYGLMQFVEMKDVIDVDEKMIDRTKKWLEKRRNKDGGFLRNSRALDKFGGAPAEHTDAYITWALTEAGLNTSADVNFVIKNCAEKKKDTYIWALTSLCLYKNNRREEAAQWARKIAELQIESGAVTDEETSITRSGGESLIVESTALSLLAWLHDQDSFSTISSKAVNFLTSCCKNGSFGSTQATLLALKAIVAYDKTQSDTLEEGALCVKVNDLEVGRINISENPSGVLSCQDFGDKIVRGENRITLEMLKGGKFPYSLALDFFALKGDSKDECAVRLQTQLVDSVLKEGKSTEVSVIVQNVTNESLPMTLAVIGIPGGLEPRIDKLKELVKSGTIDYYETLGRRIALYWRYFDANEKKEILLDVVAAVPGTYTGPASNAYLYYTDEYSWWNSGLNVQIDP
eukprot:TRINITY_DN2049_c0_g1_i3.p1 TRINITY_DN2049_c0_g1~~TRINITY_DN2049_c0_g1_i3.p1  ORF type:complete len:1420 (+),score=454.86 TRINITY_DN2049_c0_g1_i3:93-4352(+)